ncbi:MAG: hypothetical protein ACON4N_10135 [Myxococcota bacterium]
MTRFRTLYPIGALMFLMACGRTVQAVDSSPTTPTTESEVILPLVSTDAPSLVLDFTLDVDTDSEEDTATSLNDTGNLSSDTGVSVANLVTPDLINLQLSSCATPGSGTGPVVPSLVSAPGEISVTDPRVRGCCVGSLTATVSSTAGNHTITYDDPGLPSCYCQCDWQVSYTLTPVDEGVSILELPPAPGFVTSRLYSISVP